MYKLFADGGYQGPQFSDAQKKALPCVVTEIVKRSYIAKVYKLILNLTDGVNWPLSLQAAWLSSPA